MSSRVSECSCFKLSARSTPWVSSVHMSATRVATRIVAWHLRPCAKPIIRWGENCNNRRPRLLRRRLAQTVTAGQTISGRFWIWALPNMFRDEPSVYKV